MTKAEIIDRLNQYANRLKEDIATNKESIVRMASYFQGKDAEYIAYWAESITVCAKEIENKKTELREIETRISIIERIDSI